MGPVDRHHKPDRIRCDFPEIDFYGFYLSSRCRTMVDFPRLVRTGLTVLLPYLLRSDSVQSRAYGPLLDRAYALADQIYGSWRGRTVRAADLLGQPIATFFRARHRLGTD